MGVAVSVGVGVLVGVAVSVGVGVLLGVGVFVGAGVLVGAGVSVGVGGLVGAGVSVSRDGGNRVSVGVGVAVGGNAVSVGVEVVVGGNGVLVGGEIRVGGKGVNVAVDLAVGTGVSLGRGMSVALATMTVGAVVGVSEDGCILAGVMVSVGCGRDVAVAEGIGVIWTMAGAVAGGISATGTRVTNWKSGFGGMVATSSLTASMTWGTSGATRRSPAP